MVVRVKFVAAAVAYMFHVPVVVTVSTDMCWCLDHDKHWSSWHRTCSAVCSHLCTAAVSSLSRRPAVNVFSGMINVCCWFLPHTVNCIGFCFWCCLWLFVCVRNILGTAKQICTKFTGKMCSVPHSDEFEGQRWRSAGTKMAFLALSMACVQFMFGKTSLASSLSCLLFAGW